MTQARKPSLVRATDPIPEEPFSHPLNRDSALHLRSLSDAVGLQRLGFHVVRVAPGKESFVYHAHHCEEEFIYILSGRGVAEIDGEEHEVGPGDFMGFPTPSVGHHLKNPSAEELVYISGGERREAEVAEFPRQDKRLVRVGMAIAIHDTSGAIEYPGFPPLRARSDRDPG